MLSDQKSEQIFWFDIYTLQATNNEEIKLLAQ